MPNWFYDIPAIIALLMIYLTCCSISFIGYRLSRIFFQKVDSYEIVTKVVWQTILFFSTMLITFWIAINWHNLKDLRQVTKEEAQKIEVLYDYAELPGSLEYTKKIRIALMKYLNSVINQEYLSLADGQLNTNTLIDYQNLVKLINDYVPNNSLNDEHAYDRLTRAIEELSNYRAARLNYLPGELNGPLLAFFIVIIIIGCFWTGAIYSRNLLFSLIIIMSQNMIIASSTWLILEIDKPLQGAIKANKQAFIDAKIEIKRIHSRNKLYE